MNTPTSISGLRSVLQSLGFGDVLTGMDVGDPGAKEHCRQQIQWTFEQSGQTLQDEMRRKKALSYIEQFPWEAELSAGTSLATVMRAVDELRALLEEEQILRPVEVEEYEEDENGDVQSIRVAATALKAVRLQLRGLDPLADDEDEVADAADAGGSLDAYMDDFVSATTPHPFTRGERIFKDLATINVYPFDGRIHLSWLQSLAPKSGAGAAAMRFLTELADKHQVEMDLDAVPKGRGEWKIPKTKLLAFYRKFGFKGPSYEMVRKPMGAR